MALFGESQSSVSEGKNTPYIRIRTFILFSLNFSSAAVKARRNGQWNTAWFSFFILLGTGLFSYLCSSFSVHSECLLFASQPPKEKKDQIVMSMIYIYGGAVREKFFVLFIHFLFWYYFHVGWCLLNRVKSGKIQVSEEYGC